MDDVPEDLQGLDEVMADTYFWQFLAFPVVSRQLGHQATLPGDADHRLNAAPTHPPCWRHYLRLGREGRYLHRPPRREETLPLHSLNEEPYYLGIFLIGAYQEILGDLHNLLGDTHAVHVSLTTTARWCWKR